VKTAFRSRSIFTGSGGNKFRLRPPTPTPKKEALRAKEALESKTLFLLLLFLLIPPSSRERAPGRLLRARARGGPARAAPRRTEPGPGRDGSPALGEGGGEGLQGEMGTRAAAVLNTTRRGGCYCGTAMP